MNFLPLERQFIIIIIILLMLLLLSSLLLPKRHANVECGRIHNEELHNLYRSPNIVRVIKSRRFRWAGNAARMEEVGSAIKILTATSTGKRPLGRPRCK